jgi:hypothetical protein
MSKINNKGKACVAVILALGLIRKSNPKRWIESQNGGVYTCKPFEGKEISYNARTIFGS